MTKKTKNKFNVYVSDKKNFCSTGPWKFLYTVNADNADEALMQADRISGAGNYEAYPHIDNEVQS